MNDIEDYMIHIEHDFLSNQVKIYAMSRDRKAYLTMEGSNVIHNLINEYEMIPENATSLKLPVSVFNSLMSGVTKYQEARGGLPTQQSLKGEIKRYENEVTWLRDALSSLMHKK